jgi:hypothetical protein
MKRRPRHRAFRPGFAGAVKIALAIVLALELAYLLAANVILYGWLRRWVNSDEQALRLDYESAWSPWPGRVYARDLSLRVQDANIQFELRTAAVEVDVVLTALLETTFRATHLDVDGLVFRFRHKLSEPPQNPRMVQALPPIEGFADPPPLTDKKPSAPKGKLWTIHITGVDARIRELWIQQFRSLGSARAWGGFRLEPTRRLLVGPAALSLEPGALYAGKSELVARDFGGRIDARIDDTDLERLHGWHSLSRTSTHVRVKASLVDLDFLEVFVEPERLRVRNGSGPLNVDVRLVSGVLRAPSAVTYRSSRVEVQTRKITLLGDARIDLDVPDAERGRLAIAASELALGAPRENESGALIVAKSPRLELETRTLALHENWKASGGRLELPEVVARELRTLKPLLSGETQLGGGPVIGRARARLDESGAVSGRIDLRFRDLHVAKDGVRVDASGRFETSLFAPEVIGTTGELRAAKLEIDRGLLRTPDGSTELRKLEASAERIPYSDFVPKHITAGIEARFADARPVLEALGIEPRGIAAAAASFLDLSNLELFARARLEDDNIDVTLVRARTEGVRARGRWRRLGSSERGAFLLVTNLVNVGIEVEGEDTQVHPLASESWLERALGELRSGPISAGNRAAIGPRPRPARAR